MSTAVPFTLPPGRWAIGVSGGADSVALVRLAVAGRGDGGLVVAHLDHQLRNSESDDDATFVAELGRSLGLPVEIGRRDVVEQTMPTLPANPSARYRAARLAFFGDIVRRHGLDGVLLAHHADDQAETVLLRLLRGRSLAGLGGMAAETTIDGLRVVRPLLGVSRQALRDYLHTIGQPWREDASNDSADYRRNVVRRLLQQHPAWTPALLRVADLSRRLRDRLAMQSELAERFAIADLPPGPLAAEFAVRRWLIARGTPADRVSPGLCQRLLAQARDVTRSPRQHYPGGVLVRRRQKQIDCVESAAPRPPIDSAHGMAT